MIPITLPTFIRCLQDIITTIKLLPPPLGEGYPDMLVPAEIIREFLRPSTFLYLENFLPDEHEEALLHILRRDANVEVERFKLSLLGASVNFSKKVGQVIHYSSLPTFIRGINANWYFKLDSILREPTKMVPNEYSFKITLQAVLVQVDDLYYSFGETWSQIHYGKEPQELLPKTQVTDEVGPKRTTRTL
jgi:hypothetical protein